MPAAVNPAFQGLLDRTRNSVVSANFRSAELNVQNVQNIQNEHFSCFEFLIL